MTLERLPGRTPDDGELVRYLDGEASPDERTRIETEAASNPELAHRLAVLRHRATRLSALLEEADVAAPDRLTPAIPLRPRPAPGPWHSPWLRAAAAVLLLVSVTLAVPPLRARVIDGLQRILGRTESGTTAPTPLITLPSIDTFSVGFHAPSVTFLIELQSAQAGGRLIVRVADVTEGSVEVRARHGGEESPFVWSEGLRINNTPASTAEYEIVLPRHVRDVTIRIPGSSDTGWNTTVTAQRIFELGR
jgi:hypothetical protein